VAAADGEVLIVAEYTPTTEQVRDGYACDPEAEYRDPVGYGSYEQDLRRAFDRWLADHDREVAARTLEQYADSHHSPSPYYLRSCAAAIRAGGDSFPEQHTRGLYSDELVTMVEDLRAAHQIAKDWATRNEDANEVASYVRNTLDVLEVELKEWASPRSAASIRSGSRGDADAEQTLAELAERQARPNGLEGVL
jgi:hypothetical protein